MSLPKEDLHRLVDRLPEQNVARAKRYLEMPGKKRTTRKRSYVATA